MSRTLPSPPPVEPHVGVTRRWWFLPLVLALVLVLPKLLQHEAGLTEDLDTGNYSNLAWGILHGDGYAGAVLGRHHLGEHFSPVMTLVAPLYLVWHSAHWLMLLQGLAVAAGVALATRVLRRRLVSGGLDADAAYAWHAWATALLVVLALFHPPVLATWATQFQPIVLGFPLVILALLLADARRTAWLWAVVVVILTTRESAPLSVVGLGLYVLVTGPRRWRLAAALVVAAAAWAVLTNKVAMPWFRGGASWRHINYLGPWDMWDQKATYLLVLTGGLAFLPLVGRHALAATLAAVPGLLLNVATAREVQFAMKNHYDGQTAGFLLAAAACGLAHVTLHAHTRRRVAMPREAARRRVHLALLAAAALGLSAGAATLAKAKTIPDQVWQWRPTTRRLAQVAALRDIDRRYPDAPATTAHGRLGPHLCHRRGYMAMRLKTWPDFAAKRGVPNMLVVIPGERSPNYNRWLRRQIESDPLNVPVEEGAYVRVYCWNPPASQSR